MSALEQALAALARRPEVLVCCDYDGTLSPIVSDPQQAVPLPGVLDVLYELAELSGIRVAIVSGRAVADLRRLAGVDDRIVLVGSHGVEFIEGEFRGFGAEQQSLLRELSRMADQIVAGAPGAMVETKPTSFAVHVRNCDESDAQSVMAQVQDQILSRDGIFITHGKKVVEVAVIQADKGDAITTLRGGAKVLFVGDDVTDERGFAALDQHDVGVKVGSGPTAAEFEVADPEAVKRLLELFLRMRTGG